MGTARMLLQHGNDYAQARLAVHALGQWLTVTRACPHAGASDQLGSRGPHSFAKILTLDLGSAWRCR
jgi:hypothetical protein